jgi:hypothetical protein
MSKHYPLTPELAETLRNAKLTAAEWRLWSYLVTIDPFGEHYQELALLSILTECSLSKPTFYRAIARFQELGLFDTQPARIAFRNLIGARKLLAENSLKNETEVSEMRKLSQKRDSSIKSEKEVSNLRKQSQKRENEAPEPAPDIDSGSPHIDQKDQTDPSLSQISEVEREKFEIFCLKKVEELPKRPALPQRWIEANLKALWDQFQIERSSAAVPDLDWIDHPLKTEYLAALNDEGLGWIGLCRDQAEKRRRRSFFEWAQQHGLA